MKKINNKGMTLVELIVSFAIVGVAMIYFYQTVSTVSKLYATSRDDTNEYANSTYVLRLMDAYCNENDVTKYSCGDAIVGSSEAANAQSFCEKLIGVGNCTITGFGPGDTDGDGSDDYEKHIGTRFYKNLIIKLKETDGKIKEYDLLASITPVDTYIINFYETVGGEKVETVTTTSRNYDNKIMQIPYYKNFDEATKTLFNTNYGDLNKDQKDSLDKAKLIAMNQHRFVGLTSDGKNINYKYKYTFTSRTGEEKNLEYGDEITETFMREHGMKSPSDDATTYTINAVAKKGDLFIYDNDDGDDGYEVINEGSDWRIKFKTSGTFTMNTPVNIDAFLVGGGAGGAASTTSQITFGSAGGGGGSITTVERYNLANMQYFLDIGAFGAGGTSDTEAGNGNPTSIKYLNGSTIYSAAGGEAPGSGDRAKAKGNGGAGGSGKGSPGEGKGGITKFGEYYGYGGNGGVGGIAGTYSSVVLSNVGSAKGGTSSNTTGSNANANTGGGGGGAAARNGGLAGSTRKSGGNGGTGVIIISNSK